MKLGREDSYGSKNQKSRRVKIVPKDTEPPELNVEQGLNTGRFIMFSVITNIYNKKTKGPTLMELFTATGKLIFFFN